MDRELEEQIDELIQKASKDLKTKIVRVVVRHQKKLLKDQEREFKSGGARKEQRAPSRAEQSRAPPPKTSRKSSNSKYSSDTDSDDYYSD